MEICDGVSHNDSETKTLSFPKWEKEGKLKKIFKNSTRLHQETGQQLQGSGIEAKADVGIEGY